MATPASRLDAETAWTHALALYDRDGVAAACLTAQDSVGADVILLLLVAHLASLRLGLDVEGWRAVAAVGAAWREKAVQPLRSLRRGLKAGVEGVPADRIAPLRADLARLEIVAERVGHDLAVAAARVRVTEREGSGLRQSLADYLATCPAALDSADVNDLVFNLERALGVPMSLDGHS